jgi:hypothetical protein
MRPSLAETHPAIAQEWHSEKNAPETPWRITPGSRRMVWWRGLECDHVWDARVLNRTSQGQACPICSGRRVLVGTNDLGTVLPGVASQWHPQLNGSTEPHDVTASSNIQVWWLCSDDHVWRAPVYSRKSGRGCPSCSGNRVIVGVTDLGSVRPDVALEWDVAMNTSLTPSDVSAGSNRKVWWRCAADHSWSASVVSRVSGSGCGKCHGNDVSSGENDLETLRPLIASEWDRQRNLPLLPSEVTISSGKKVWWRCARFGHSWLAPVASRTGGSGCALCSGRRVDPGRTDLATTHPVLAREWHPTKNGLAHPAGVLAGSVLKTWWTCSLRGHEWQSTIKSRALGSRCPRCSKFGSSVTERSFFRVLARGLTDAALGARIPLVTSNRKSMSVDISGTLAGRKIAIEYDGRWYHEHREAQDREKTEALLRDGWITVRIREGVLTDLDMADDDLLQIGYLYRAGDEARTDGFTEPVAAEIIRWITRRTIVAA